MTNSREQKQKQEKGGHSWDRMKGESKKMYNYFTYYLELGPQRTHQKVADKHGITRGRVKKISMKWQWTRRVEDHTEHLRLAALERYEEEYIGLQADTLTVLRKTIKALDNNITSYNQRQETRERLSQSTSAGLLLNHERALSEHVHTYHLVCGKPDKIEPNNTINDENRRIQEYQTDEEIRGKLDTLIREGSAEKQTSQQQEDKE